jgi:hypothetical protein
MENLVLPTNETLLADATITVECEPEMQSVRGAFATGEDELDRQLESEIQDRIDRGDEWAWCCVRVTVELAGIKVASSWLGGCSYDSEAQFREVGGYFDDLRAEAFSELRARFADVIAACTRRSGWEVLTADVSQIPGFSLSVTGRNHESTDPLYSKFSWTIGLDSLRDERFDFTNAVFGPGAQDVLHQLQKKVRSGE